jgi:hypothetical protein
MADKDRAFSYSSYLPQRLLNIFQDRKPTPGLQQQEITESRPLEDTLTDLQILSQLPDAHNHEYRPVPNAPRVERTEAIRHNSVPDLSQRQPVSRESSAQQNIDNRLEDIVGRTSRSSTLQVPGSRSRDRRGGSEVSQTEEDFDDEGHDSGSFQDDSAYGDTPFQRPQDIPDLSRPETTEERIQAQFRAFVTPEREPQEQDGLPLQESSPKARLKARIRRGSKVVLRKVQPSKELWQTIPDEPNTALSRSAYVDRSQNP